MQQPDPRRALKDSNNPPNGALAPSSPAYATKISHWNSTINTGQLPKYWVEDALPAIIEPNVFDAVQAEIARRRAIGPAGTPSKNTGCFTGKITCPACGCNYQRQTRAQKRLPAYRFWRCWNTCRGAGNPCGGHNLREEILQDLMVDLLGLDSFDEDVVQEELLGIDAYPDRLEAHLADGRSITMALDAKGRLV